MNRRNLPFLIMALLVLAAGVLALDWSGEIAPWPAAAESIAGDVDGNGEVNSIDAFLILQHDAGIIWPPPYSEEYYQSADVNEDGFVSVVDVSLILQFHAGLIQTLDP